MLYTKVAIIVFRSIFAFIILLALGRIVGRKMISRITFFDFIIGVTLGSLGVRLALGADDSLLGNIVAGITIILMVLLIDVCNLKSYLFRKLEEGKPIILVENGIIHEKNLKKVRISLNKLLMLLREKDVFNMDDVYYAIIENDGELSVLLKPDRQALKAADMNVPISPINLPLDLIIDGKIIYENLVQSGHDIEWITAQLKSQNIRSEKDVLYACINPVHGFYISPRTGPSK
ncbi:DUF421 domain-containing protein [Ethanoligenens harbinense]|uniref:YetF C-terminal domain-containing protein n=1 Tax=Ethanoligenens harbinense (strain DSM 18485 / JCM 12961 / CGMCC 1.5033 / YUAN-3) TaxID=663278 RepID=E6U505_ETHHY|nr:DUF421 domain-containing protein [Ethanoligenens harbinense]ADU26711.1 protein of unknown function DUF421 [Ethanoligenens harbinense YUAN-3]